MIDLFILALISINCGILTGGCERSPVTNLFRVMYSDHRRLLRVACVRARISASM